MDKCSIDSEDSKERSGSTSSFKSWLNKSVSLTQMRSSFSTSSDSINSELSIKGMKKRTYTVCEEGDYSFRDNLQGIRNCIKRKFQLIKGRINHLEDKMMDTLEDIERSYSLRLLEKKEAMDKAQNLKSRIDDLVTDNSLQAGINDLIQEKLIERSNPTEICVTLQWPTGLETYLNQLGDALKKTIHDDIASPLDSPPLTEVVRVPTLQAFGRMGQGAGDMVSPRAVTITKEGLVYCTDWENDVIMSFTPYGELIHSITNVKHPYGIHAHEDKLYVTEANISLLKFGKMGSHACVKMFSLDGSLLSKVGKWGSGNGQFKSPSGLTVYEEVEGECEVFVCDTDNNRIQILNSELQFVRLFVAGKVKQPDDVKVNNMRVYVLDKRNPCLHIFTLQGGALAHIISHGPGRDLESSFFFTLDKSGCVIMGDHEKNCLKVFTPSGKLARIIGNPNSKTGEFYLPLGISQSEDDQMAVVSLKQTGCIQLFNMNFSLISF